MKAQRLPASFDQLHPTELGHPDVRDRQSTWPPSRCLERGDGIGEAPAQDQPRRALDVAGDELNASGSSSITRQFSGFMRLEDRNVDLGQVTVRGTMEAGPRGRPMHQLQPAHQIALPGRYAVGRGPLPTALVQGLPTAAVPSLRTERVSGTCSLQGPVLECVLHQGQQEHRRGSSGARPPAPRSFKRTGRDSGAAAGPPTAAPVPVPRPGPMTSPGCLAT